MDSKIQTVHDTAAGAKEQNARMEAEIEQANRQLEEMKLKTEAMKERERLLEERIAAVQREYEDAQAELKVLQDTAGPQSFADALWALVVYGGANPPTGSSGAGAGPASSSPSPPSESTPLLGMDIGGLDMETFGGLFGADADSDSAATSAQQDA